MTDPYEYDDEGHMSSYARCVARCGRAWRGQVPIRMMNRWIGGYATHDYPTPGPPAAPDDFVHDLLGDDDGRQP